MLRAFGTWPAANSCGSRTSTIVQGGGPTASSKSPKLTMSGSEPAPKRENMFQDILPPKSYGRPPSNSAERVSYRQAGPRFEGSSRAAIDRVLRQIVVMLQRAATAISSAERPNCEPPKQHSFLLGAPSTDSLT